MIDLHIHSNCSDGVLTPVEIIDRAVLNNVKIISIADHDTIDAYSDELFEYAEENGVLLIPAVEISCKGKKCGIHVLGYNFDLYNEEFRDLLFKLRNVRHIYLHDVADRLKELGYRVNVLELDKIEAVTKAHIALDVVESKDNYDKLMRDFGHIPEKGEFIETIMNEGCPAYVAKMSISPVDAAKAITKANGKVVLAHPVAYVYEDNLDESDILELITEIKPDGIEAEYIYVDREHNVIDDCGIWEKFAKKNNLNITMGSDFHKNDGVHPDIGFVNVDIDVDEEKIDSILENLI